MILIHLQLSAIYLELESKRNWNRNCFAIHNSSYNEQQRKSEFIIPDFEESTTALLCIILDILSYITASLTKLDFLAVVLVVLEEVLVDVLVPEVVEPVPQREALPRDPRGRRQPPVAVEKALELLLGAIQI